MTILAVVYAGVLLVANAVLTTAFVVGPCGGDGGAPGSDRDAYCGFLAGSPTEVGYAFLAAALLAAGFSLWALRGLRNAEAAGGA